MANDAEQFEQLTAYLDGELSAAQRAEVDRLLAEDTGARALLDELRQTSWLVSALPREPVPEGLADAVVNRMERRDLLGESPPHRATSSRVVSWSRRFAVAASIALVGTAVWIAWPHFSQLMNAEKQPARFAQADKVQEPSTPPRFIAQGGGSKTGKSKSLRPSARPATGGALAERAARVEAPLAQGGIGGGIDSDEEGPSAEAEDEAVPALAERFVAKVESHDAVQPAARVPTTPESVKPVIVETDVATIAGLTSLFEENMARHGVPMLQADSKEKLAQSDEPYYTLRRAAALVSAPFSVGAPRPIADVSGDEVHIVMRVSRDVAEQVLADINRSSDETDAAAGWSRVGRPFAPSRSAGRASNRTDEEDLPVSEKEDVQKDAPPTSDLLEKKRTISTAEQDAAGPKDGGSLDEKRSPAQKSDRSRSILRLAASQPALPQDEPLVTLTIHLRTKPAISPPQTTQPSTQPVELPTSQAVPRSTTQEAPSD